MLPVLKFVSDGREYRMTDIINGLANFLKLTEEERVELLPSGQTPLLNNRVHWAKTYLKNQD